jgi:hypothetical protein
MRRPLVLASLLLALALVASPAHAAPLGGVLPPADGPLLRVDWFDDLFGISLPPGSWRDSCRKARVDGHFLNAECRRKSGGWKETSFDLRRCAGDIANDNGKLICDREARGEGESEQKPRGVDPGKD